MGTQPPSRRRRPIRAAVLVLLGFLGGFLAPYLWWIDRLVTGEMAAAHWQAPTAVYGQSMRWPAGEAVSRSWLERRLQMAGYRPGHALSPGRYQVNGNRIEVQGPGRFPGGGEVTTLDLTAGTLRVNGPVRSEPVLIGTVRGSQDRLPVSLGEVPPDLLFALQAVEDRSFKTHHGLSLRAIARALWANLREGAVVQGGSTLSQQLVKTLFLTREKRWLRKLHEAALAALLEARYDKGQILEAYLNAVFLGQDGGRAIYGVGRAAEFYFGRPLAQLSLHQHALIVGLLRGPSYYNPWRHPERAIERRNRVLRALYQTGVISRSQSRLNQARGLDVLSAPGGSGGRYPAYLGLVWRQMLRSGGSTRQGLHVETGFSALHQEAAEIALVETLAQVEIERGLPGSSLEGAVLVLSRNDGSVMAAVGGRAVDYPGFNRVRDAHRPIGSLIKPFVLLAALERGYRLSNIIDDRPLNLALDDGTHWSPDNFDGTSLGPIRLVDALAQSRNQATARLGLELGVDAVAATLNRLGLTRRPSMHPALLLGAIDLSPLEVGQLYLALAQGAAGSPVRAVERIVDAQGRERFRHPPPAPFEPGDAEWLVRHAMKQVVSQGTARSLSTWLESQTEGLAGKTGTTNANRDSWFVGITGDLVVVVWVGRDDNQAAGITGATAALPVAARLLSRTGWQPLPQEPPETVRFLWVDVEDRLADEHCPDRDYLPFRRGTEPEEWAECARPRRSWWPFSR